MPCYCGASDCKSCGPAQGYKIVRVFQGGRYVMRELEDLIEEARDGDAAFNFAADLDPEDAALFIARMISTASLDEKHAAISRMIDRFEQAMLEV